MTRLLPVTAELAVSVSRIAVSAAYGSSGIAVDSTDSSTSVKLTNQSDVPIEYRVGSGSWIALDDRVHVTLNINLASTTLKLRKGQRAGLRYLAQVDIESLSGDYVLGDSSHAFGGTTLVASSRELAVDDNGRILECTATVTLTVPAGLPTAFGCVVIPSGTTSIASGGGTLLNGATSTLTRAAASNPMIAVVARASAEDSYVISGS